MPTLVDRLLDGSASRHAARALWVVWGLLIALATLRPSDRATPPTGLCLACGELGGVDLILNVLLFVPLGIGLAMDRVAVTRAMLMMVALTVAIELLQRHVVPGRDPSLGDIVANAAGGGFGFVVGTRIGALVRPGRAAAQWLAAASLTGWVAMQAFAAYAMQPAPTTSEYFGQHMRRLGHEAQYAGRVLEASVGGVRVPDWELADWRGAHLTLASDSGAALRVQFTSGGPPRDDASIVRIKDAEARDIVRLGSHGAAATYSVRTRAEDLRLRPLQFRLREALPQGRSTAARDTVRAEARYARRGVSIRVDVDERTTRSGSIRLSPSAGWRLLAPAEVYIDGSRTDALLDAGWIAGWLTLAGYWLGMAAAGSRRSGGALVILAGAPALAALVAGLVLVPRSAGLSPATWWEGSAGLAGIVAGCLLAQAARRAHAGRGTGHAGDAERTAASRESDTMRARP